VQIVAKDGGSDICDTMAADPAYEKAVDIVGLHYPSDFKNYSVCHSLHKPFWASEESSSYDDINGAACWARVVTSHYVLAKITSSIMWNLIGSYYHGTNWYASSMLTAVEPWTGHFSVADEDLAVVYATAHVTQFTKVGWYYLAVGDGSGELQHGGYYVTLVDPKGTDWTMNIVKIDESHAPCTRPKLPDLQVVRRRRRRRRRRRCSSHTHALCSIPPSLPPLSTPPPPLYTPGAPRALLL
jgi:galactosylceramidase